MRKKNSDSRKTDIEPVEEKIFNGIENEQEEEIEIVPGIIKPYHVYYLSGEITKKNIAEIKTKIVFDKNLMFSLDNLQFISSDGLRMLFDIRKECETKELSCYIRNIPTDLVRIFQMTGYSSILNIYTQNKEEE